MSHKVFIINNFIIPESDKNPTVFELLEVISNQSVEIEKLKAEVTRLKKHPQKPKLKPSKIGQTDTSIGQKRKNVKNDSRDKKDNHKKNIEIHETVRLAPPNIPEGSKLVKSRPYTIQNIIIKANNIRYLREIWQTPDGKYIKASPLKLVKGHYGDELKAYILNLYFGSHISQVCIREQLAHVGIVISAGQINRILTENHDSLHEEAEKILETGLRYSNYICADDTGLRHKGRNGYSTHIGNQFFAYFKSSYSKSRLNFLKILRGRHTGYYINTHSLEYLKASGFPREKILLIERVLGKEFLDDSAWQECLKQFSIIGSRHVRTVTEASLIGWLTNYYGKELFIVSDEAGQFRILKHSLCWIHTERKLSSLIPSSDEEVELQKKALDHFWQFYRLLKLYQSCPKYKNLSKIKILFEKLFTQETKWSNLNKALKSIYDNSKELLMVLSFPAIPLHNNESENDIREVVKKRKISAGTRSDLGRKCRDTFMSLKKTCRKLDVPFWDFLLDRICKEHKIQPLHQVMLGYMNTS